MGRKIYISATYSDLKECRAAAYRILRMLRHDVISMEDYVATDASPLHKCLEDVAGCDVYIGVIGWHYGYIPNKDNPQHRSITELEYRRADESNLPCLIFLSDKDAPGPDIYRDSVTGEGEQGKLVMNFRAELEKEHLVSYFKTPDQLAGLISVAVQQLPGQKEDEPSVLTRLSRGSALVGGSLTALLGISVLALISLYSSIQIPYLGPFALICGIGSIGLSIVQYRLSRPPPRFDRNRAPLLQRLQRWVNDQLDSALAGTHCIALDFVTRPDAVARPYGQGLSQSAPYRLPAGTKISTLFGESGGALLILGSPGSGKTTLLLELTRELIARAEHGTDLPVPIIFKLSSWDDRQSRQGQPSLAEWLIQELDKQYDVPPDLGKFMIATNQLLPLLDGLDDVRMLEERNICAKAINVFRRQYPSTPLVVSCRAAEYDDLQIKLRLEKAIEVQPLSREQINAYLAHLSGSHIGLSRAFAEDSALGELATAPLILAIMTQVYCNVPAPVLGTHDEGKTDRSALRGQLFDAYIERMFERQTSVDLPREQLKGWLVTLAHGMLQNAQQVFVIEQLQPSWLASGRDRIGYALLDRLGGGLAAALVVGAIVGLSYGLGGGIVAGLANGVRWGLVSGLVVGLLGRTHENNGQLLSVGGSLMRRALLGALIFGTVGGTVGELYLLLLDRLPDVDFDGITFRAMLADVLFFALVGAFGSAILHGPSLRPRMVQIMENQRWCWSRGLPIGLAVGITVALVSTYVYSLLTYKGEALVFGLVYGLSVWIILGLVTGEVEAIAQPNQRIRRTVRSVMRVGLAAGVVSGLGSILGGFAVGRPEFGLVYGISSAVLVGLFGAIVSGGYACLSHFALRLVLWRSSMLPWDLAAFLDDAAKRVLLRRAGGGYTFIHRLLLEHIAGMR